MKKILIGLIFAVFTFAPASADLGVNLGISGNLAVFHGTGEESENGELSREDATGVAGYTSVFIEKTLGDRLLIGIDYVPSPLESETVESIVEDEGSGLNPRIPLNYRNQKVQIDFEDLTTYYIALNITDSFYVKTGLVYVDVITNETLATGSTYTNTDMDGSMYGLGFAKNLDNGLFVRAEGAMIDLGSASVTASNTDNKVSLKDLEGASAKISVGKSF